MKLETTKGAIVKRVRVGMHGDDDSLGHHIYAFNPATAAFTLVPLYEQPAYTCPDENDVYFCNNWIEGAAEDRDPLAAVDAPLLHGVRHHLLPRDRRLLGSHFGGNVGE